MDNILSTDEYKEVDGRQYLDPQVALDESNTFIDNLRSTQDQQNQEIFTDTQKLGTNVPSVEGGLTGGNSYFTSRYQTPMTNAAVANLRATAQAQALNQALQNEQEIWKKKYQDAYRNYQKRQYDRANSGGGNPGGNNEINGGIKYIYDGETTDLSAEQDKNRTSWPIEGVDYTETEFNNRGRQVQNNAEITRDKSGNVTAVIINGIPHYGREAKARYRDLKRKGIVK